MRCAGNSNGSNAIYYRANPIQSTNIVKQDLGFVLILPASWHVKGPHITRINQSAFRSSADRLRLWKVNGI